MGSQATGTFKIESWDERPYVETDEGGKLTRASVKQTFGGDIAGEGAVEWLMCYRPDKTADFVGLQRVVGQLGDRSGTFVLQTTGSFDGKEAKGAWSVLAGSGTDDLAGLRGSGGFS